MDDLVLRGMAKWPNVPAVYGWLALDRRGQWLIKGERITNPIVRDFIGRNYTRDAEGHWFFQNGPQRVFVTLHYTPVVYRVLEAAGAPLALQSHTGAAADRVSGVWLDENGVTLIETQHGVGLVHDLDLAVLLPFFTDPAGAALDEAALAERMDLLCAGRQTALSLQFNGNAIPVQAIASRDVARRFGFVPDPEPPAGADTCR